MTPGPCEHVDYRVHRPGPDAAEQRVCRVCGTAWFVNDDGTVKTVVVRGD